MALNHLLERDGFHPLAEIKIKFKEKIMYIKHTPSAYSKMLSEANSLTEDEYLRLGELFKQFKESQDRDSKAMIICDIDQYIEKFPADSTILFYYKNWAKITTKSDSYMVLVASLSALAEHVYEGNLFMKLL